MRAGNIEFLKVNSVVWDWRDTYHWLLSLTWPRFALFLLGSYVGVNVVFATLYCTVPGGIAEMPSGSFLYAFFFSVETLATVGYGHMYPLTLAGHLVATAEILVGMFGMAVITGLIFVRFSRPTASLVFSEGMVISNFDGVPALMIRVANQRNQPMVEAEFRMMMIRTELTKEGEEVARFYPLRLQLDRTIMFPAAMTIRHFLDEGSPLYGITPERLAKEKPRFVTSIVCVDPVVSASVQSQYYYLWENVKFAHRFVEIYSVDGAGRFVVDYGRLHETEAAEVRERMKDEG